MPKARQPLEIWRETRLRVWKRDGGKCVRCKKMLTLDEAHIDHIQSGKLGGNELANLRTLCIICHALRADQRHRWLTAKLLQKKLLPPDWRKLVWSD